MSLWALVSVARCNAARERREFDAWLDRLLDGSGGYTREGIDVDLWRALPDSPNA